MTAAEKMLAKALVGSKLDTKEWAGVQAGLRDRAFFMAQVEDARILHAARQGVADMLESGKSQSEVRRDIRRVLSNIGYDPDKGLKEGDPSRRGTIKDLLTERRLDMMIETNVGLARGYAEHLRATTEGALRAFPAYELVRVKQRKKPRDWDARWKAAAQAVGWEGVAKDGHIALKTSPIWTELSAFDSPHPPFDFNSGMGVDDVSRRECIKIGLIDEDTPPQKPPKVHLNGSLQAEVPNMRGDSDEAEDLRKKFGDQIRFDNGVVHWRGHLIQDVLDGKLKKVNLGEPTPAFISMAYEKLPKNTVDALVNKRLGFSHQFFVEHGGKHIDPNEPFEHLTRSEFELIPSMWRSPSRLSKTRDPNRVQVELDTLDGNTLLMIVDCRNGLKSIQKRKTPGGIT